MTHQERAVPAEGVHFFVRARQLSTQRAIDLIAHIGVAVLHVVGAPVLGTEQTLHIPGQRTGRAKSNGVVGHKLVDNAQSQSLVQPTGQLFGIVIVYNGFPLSLGGCNLTGIGSLVSGQSRQQCL